MKNTLVDAIWSVADLLRGDFQRSRHDSVLVPFTVLRRMDCIRQYEMRGQEPETTDAAGLGGLLQAHGDRPEQDAEMLLAEELRHFVQGFPRDVVEILDSLEFLVTVQHLARAGLLARVVNQFAILDLSPTTVSAEQMGQHFEKLIRRLSDMSSEVSGEHTTPHDVAMLTARLVLGPHIAARAQMLTPVRIYDPCCGAGGSFSAAEEVLKDATPHYNLAVSGQDINRESYAIARAQRMMRGAEPSGIAHGNVLTDDKHQGETFEFVLTAPPLGLDWKRTQVEVKREFQELGFDGRFGAGLPPTSDASLLFVQHVVAHMRPADEGGSRSAILLSGLSLNAGSAGSGGSEIRKWLIEQDLLEGVIALPPSLLHNTDIPMYICLLSNRKVAHLQGKVTAVDARRCYTALSKSLGSKRNQLTEQHIAEIVRRYETAHGITVEEGREASGEEEVWLFDADDLGYQLVSVEPPLRQHFTVTDGALDRVKSGKALTAFAEAEALLGALGTMRGQIWITWSAFEQAFSTALLDAGLDVEIPRPLWRLIHQAIGVSDPNGEVQKDAQGRRLPDRELGHVVRVPLRQDVNKYVRKEVLPDYPSVNPDLSRIKVGYELPEAPFHIRIHGSGFGPLSKVARLIPSRLFAHKEADKVPLLRGRDLQSAKTAEELPKATDIDKDPLRLASCTGGDIVGQFGSWHILPLNFGEALTPLNVLRPLGNGGRALCEWLRAQYRGAGTRWGPRVSADMLVPVELIKDSDFGFLMDDLENGRDALASSTSRILPNVFRDDRTGIDEVRRTARAVSSQARIVGDLVKPLENPAWRAEWGYPYQVAGVARQYRIATTLAQRKEALLKLGESVARCVGILAVAVQISRKEEGFTRGLQNPFTRGDGMTFGGWNRRIKELVEDGPVPELPELERSLDLVTDDGLLTKVLDVRNHTGHRTRVQPEHELAAEVEELEPAVMEVLESVGWLSGLHWNLVDLCAYADGEFTLIGWRLRGAHPDWEPFEQPHRYPLEPKRIYVQSPSAAEPLKLWPIARVEVCMACQTRELFLLHKVAEKNRIMTLRCGRDHEIDSEIQ
ncbi:class I SAM-dependent DNA methyltransferase [Nocardiopsis dassonvillei]|uniref:class I SAM-dependent DNA methyltransferase n=1 Tax=Nocardiopsis dassonvillei TaxID=2014 RepID=UPI0036451D32